ncbi:MAG: hypothetical protein WC208_14915 [Gallionella sp.]|jgi:hypothetical protein
MAIHAGPLLMLAPVVAAGVAAMPATPTDEFIYRSFMALISLLVMIAGFFMVRTLRQIDDNQADIKRSNEELFKKINDLGADHYELRGEHNSQMRMGGCGK